MKIILINRRTIKYISLVVTILFILSLSSALIAYSPITAFTEQQLEKSNDEVAVPIIMYHSVLKQSANLGKYVITPTELENDLKYLSDRGYSAINMTELIDYVYTGSPLPAKPVIITFDDGLYNNYAYGRPLLEKYKMKAVISIVGKYSEDYSIHPSTNLNYAHISWDQLKEITDSGYFEIQNHTYNMHSTGVRLGTKRKRGESLEQYKMVLNSDISKLQQKITLATGITPNTFTYPFGFISKESEAILKDMGFKASLSCYEGVNKLKVGDTESLYQLKRKNRPHGISTTQFFKNFCP